MNPPSPPSPMPQPCPKCHTPMIVESLGSVRKLRCPQGCTDEVRDTQGRKLLLDTPQRDPRKYLVG